MADTEDANIQQNIAAFADGELEAAQALDVLRYLSANPEALQMLREQQRLRFASSRTIVDATPCVPPDLRQQIEAMVHPPGAVGSAGAIGSIGPSALMLRNLGRIAAVLVIGIGAFWIGRQSIKSNAGNQLAIKPPESNPEQLNPGQSNPPLTIAQVEFRDAATRVHVDCSRFPTRHSNEFPKELGALSQAVQQDLHLAGPYPDLSKVGFNFMGAGPCAKPLENTVHLLYVPTDRYERDTLSIFIQPFNGQVKWEANKFFSLTGPDAAHPVLAWRTERVVYFMVGDALPTLRKAQDSIAAVARF